MKNIKEMAEKEYPFEHGIWDRVTTCERRAYIKGATDAMNQWVSVETPPTHQNWVRVLYEGVAHILPHWYRKGKWYAYDGNSAIATISHWQEFDNLLSPPVINKGE